VSFCQFILLGRRYTKNIVQLCIKKGAEIRRIVIKEGIRSINQQSLQSFNQQVRLECEISVYNTHNAHNAQHAETIVPPKLDVILLKLQFWSELHYAYYVLHIMHIMRTVHL
jgi:hypothetical protein